jgi:hypothetical protein
MPKSRFDRLEEQHGESLAEDLLREYDGKYWALYRATDLSQEEVMNAVRSSVGTSQSTVSRVAKEGDVRALTDPEFVDIGGSFGSKDGFDDYPEEWLEALRDVYARALADRFALDLIVESDRPTPEWAAKRFPELVGCYHYYDRKISERFDMDYEASKNVQESHLSHLESVNTERWK